MEEKENVKVAINQPSIDTVIIEMRTPASNINGAGLAANTGYYFALGEATYNFLQSIFNSARLKSARCFESVNNANARLVNNSIMLTINDRNNNIANSGLTGTVSGVAGAVPFILPFHNYMLEQGYVIYPDVPVDGIFTLNAWKFYSLSVVPAIDTIGIGVELTLELD